VRVKESREEKRDVEIKKGLGRRGVRMSREQLDDFGKKKKTIVTF
jgi:hypothetical protein